VSWDKLPIIIYAVNVIFKLNALTKHRSKYLGFRKLSTDQLLVTMM